MIIVFYRTKKELKANVGKALAYVETSMFGAEYRANGKFCVSNRPGIAREKAEGEREFFAEVWMKEGIIARVS